MGAAAPKRKKRRLKKSARRTIAALLLVTALIVAAIPVEDVKAEDQTPSGYPQSVDYFDSTKWIDNANLTVTYDSGNVKKGYLLDEEHKCVLDEVHHLPIPIYDIEPSSFTLVKYNTDVTYLIQDKILPLENDVGYESTKTITQKVRYTLNAVSENEVPPILDVVYDKEGIAIYAYDNDGERIAAPNPIPAYTSEEIIEPYKCEEFMEIKQIADKALEGVQNFTKVKIPDFIVKIGNEAFKGCTALTSATFSNNLKTIGNQAFTGCTNLSSVQFIQASSCITIGTAAFADCRSLSTFEYPHSIMTTGPGLFYGCESLTNVEMTEVTAGDEKIKVANYTTMGDYTFMNCKNLRNISLCPYLATIGNCTFAGCDYLTEVTMPSQERQVQYTKDTFWNCWSLRFVKVMNPKASFADYKEFSSIPVNDRFYIWGPDPSKLDKNVNNIYKYATNPDANYTYYYIDDDGIGHYEKTINGFKFAVDENGQINRFEVTSDVAAGSTLEIPAVIGPYDVRTIGRRCFHGSIDGTSKIAHVFIPSTIEYAGVEAFAELSGLKTVTIETNGISLDVSCFGDCPLLDSVEFKQVTNPAGVTTIETECFAGCNNLKSVSFRDDDFRYGEILDTNVTFIGEDAFKLDSPAGQVLTMKGRIDTDYEPFKYATNPNNKVNGSTKPYIKYISGNPTNLECIYDPELNNGNGAVSLLTYPSASTVIGTLSGNQTYTVADINAGSAPFTDPLSQVTSDIIRCTEDIVVPVGITSIDYAVKDYESFFRNAPAGLKLVTLNGVTSLPTFAGSSAVSGSTMLVNSGAFANNKNNLIAVNFGADITDIGTLPFYDANSVLTVNFSDAETYPGTIDNKYYWCEKSIIFSSYEDESGKEVITLEEVLPSRGMQGGTDIFITADETQDVTMIADKAFQNCDYITSVNFSTAANLRAIPKDCFYSCDHLNEVVLPASVNDIGARAFAECDDYIKVTIPAREVYIHDTAFDGDAYATVYSFEDSAAARYARDHTNVTFLPLADTFTVTFADYDGTVIETQTVVSGEDAKPPADPVRDGYTFTGWRPNYTAITSDRTCIAQYTASGSASSSSGKTSGSTSKTSSTKKTTSSSKSTSSSSTSSSSSSSTSSSSSSSTLSGVAAAGGRTSAARTSGGSNAGTSSARKNAGGTKVIANTSGISDIGKISATVNGSTDSYVIKITDSAEATAAVEQALIAEFGSLDALRYLPMDISIYDSTGTTKISPLPEGISVSITLPIPDDLAIYGGNSKPANAEGGVLSKLNPRFTVINGVPCITFTATHFSPYVVYVDTSNLSAAGSVDATPVTGDPIHPKWFLVIGLSAIAVVLFLKRDSEEKLKMA